MLFCIVILAPFTSKSSILLILACVCERSFNLPFCIFTLLILNGVWFFSFIKINFILLGYLARLISKFNRSSSFMTKSLLALLIFLNSLLSFLFSWISILYFPFPSKSKLTSNGLKTNHNLFVSIKNMIVSNKLIKVRLFIFVSSSFLLL